MRKMKPSGVEWIGDIPQEWEVSRIGYLFSERKVKVSDKEYEPLSVTMQGIVPQLSTAAKTDAHDDRKLVCNGDFVINSRSDRRGSCGISKARRIRRDSGKNHRAGKRYFGVAEKVVRRKMI